MASAGTAAYGATRVTDVSPTFVTVISTVLLPPCGKVIWREDGVMARPSMANAALAV